MHGSVPRTIAAYKHRPTALSTLSRVVLENSSNNNDDDDDDDDDDGH